jgi:hypothetical protein
LAAQARHQAEFDPRREISVVLHGVSDM